jgi:hypothetical protein
MGNWNSYLRFDPFLELKGRVIQLEHSWRMVHEPMPDAEGDPLLKEVFPG